MGALTLQTKSSLQSLSGGSVRIFRIMKTTFKVGNITADSLVHTIKDVLLRMKVKLSERRDQCYDGPSNMSGSRNGVATQIIAEEKCAVYTHCCGHALNIVVGHAIKLSKICHDALETVFEISKLIKFSPRKNAAFDHIKADIPEEEAHTVIDIWSFGPTRWTVRGGLDSSILDNYLYCTSSGKNALRQC